MANPPVLPRADPGIAVPPSDWEDWFGGILHGKNPGQQKSTTERIGEKAVSATEPGGLLTGDFWHRLLLDVEVYGFLILLAATGLYGLFAPGVNVVVKEAAEAVAEGTSIKRNIRKG